MRLTPHSRAAGPIGLGFLALLCLRLTGSPPPTPVAAQGPFQFGLLPVRGPSARAMREARYWRVCAMQEVNDQFEALEAWDPGLEGGPRSLHMWLELMAGDRAGHLARALAAARQAVHLAQDRREAFKAGLLLARLECETGDHQAELRQAKRVMALAPGDWLALHLLRRAEECHGLESKRVPGRSMAQHKG
jgi:hypothetical protein